MPRPTNFISVVQKLVREQVQRAIHGLLGSATPKKKAKDSGGGCSMTSTSSSGSSSLPIVGVLLGLAALSRRRRAT